MRVIPRLAALLLLVPAIAAAAPREREAEPPTPLQMRLAPLALPEPTRDRIEAAIGEAGPNGEELLAALERAPRHQREAVAFLVANMPPDDLQSLDADFLLENTRLAFEARDRAPWGRELPPEIFLNDVLPYANVNERRERWRPDFVDRFGPLVRGATTPGQAAAILNREIFTALGVEYHATLREKPDQSPSESIEVGYASCTGLSILLVDACRAVGVPARLVGTAKWTTQEGNHTWVEIWDGQWRYIGAAEPGEYDDTWFTEHAARANPDSVHTRIHAVSFRREPVRFPMVWADSVQTVSAVDVTPFYTHRREARIVVKDGSANQEARARVTVLRDGIPVADRRVTGECLLQLAAGVNFEVRARSLDGTRGAARKWTITGEPNPTLTLVLTGTGGSR